MKKRFNMHLAAVAMGLAMVGLHGTASAQSSIQIVAEPFQTNPVIPFAPFAPAVQEEEKPKEVAVIVKESWIVKPGSLLRDTLREWSKKSGWSLVWGLSDQNDFRLETGNSYEGDFKAAIFGLINSLPATVRIRAELRTDNVPPLLYVTNEEGVR